MKSVAVIVDAYSSGNFLAPEFKKRGVDCIHVQSTQKILPILKKSFIPSDFRANYADDGQRDKLLHSLREWSIMAVVPGTETGVHLADFLSETLNLKSNGTKLSPARRNKFLMIEALGMAGIPVARQLKSSNVAELVAFKNKLALNKVVVKPIESAGSEDVRICETNKDIERAHNAIVGKVNMLGLLNHESLVQEFLEGSEYFINSVSLNSKHVICDIWRHNKRPFNGFDFVYDRAELCDDRDPVVNELIAYTMRALDALNIHFGPCHSEIMLTPDGPRLVEMGARLQGMSLPMLNDACIGFGPVDLTVDCYADEAQYLKKAKDYHVKSLSMRVNLISDRTAMLKRFDIEKLKTLKSFFYVRPIAEPNTQISQTINYFTVPGFVVLVSNEKEQLEHDYRTIRSWEHDGKILIYE